MSAEATGWVFKFSPYKGVAFAVHLAIADSVNDQNDNEFWLDQGKLASKARCRRQGAQEAIARMVEDGLLTVLAERIGGRGNRYRMEMPTGTPQVYDGRRKRDLSAERTTPDEPVMSAEQAGDVRRTDSDLSAERTTREPNREPKTEPKEELAKTPAKPRPRDLVFETVAEVCGIDWRNDLTPSARGQLARAVRDLKLVGAEPDEIRARSENYRRTYPGISLTPTALTKHWPQLARAPLPEQPKDRFVEMAERFQEIQERGMPDERSDQGSGATSRSLPAGPRP